MSLCFSISSLRAIGLALLVRSTVAARVCGTGYNSTGYSLRITDFRYDGADSSNNDQFATVSVGLTDSSRPLYPLYGCNVEWPESWAGWSQGGSDIIWSDCIPNGVASLPSTDKTVSFALDWRSKTMYLAHTFACSDRTGSEGLATGSVSLDLECKNDDGPSYCVLQRTTAGTVPVYDIGTRSLPAPVNTTSTCTVTSSLSASKYHSWRLDNWSRTYRMPAGSLAPGSTATPNHDTGPSFTLTSITSGCVFNCTTGNPWDQTGIFRGYCQSEAAPQGATVEFTFDQDLNILTVRQDWDGRTLSSDIVGVEYMQASCDRQFNSEDVYVCSSPPVWFGAGIPS